jgi:hypothetical protein
MLILLLAVRIACAVQFGLRVRTVDGRTLPELTIDIGGNPEIKLILKEVQTKMELDYK